MYKAGSQQRTLYLGGAMISCVSLGCRMKWAGAKWEHCTFRGTLGSAAKLGPGKEGVYDESRTGREQSDCGFCPPTCQQLNQIAKRGRVIHTYFHVSYTWGNAVLMQWFSCKRSRRNVVLSGSTGPLGGEQVGPPWLLFFTGGSAIKKQYFREIYPV